jgi:hypothetical protein
MTRTSIAPDVAHAVAWGDRPPPKPMRLISFKPIIKGSLRGFATVELPIGLVIEECPVLVGLHGAWAALPSKPVLDREGRQAKPDGKPQYAAIMKWRDRELQNRFSQAVVDLVRDYDSDALDPDAAA